MISAKLMLLVALVMGDSHAAGHPGRLLSEELWLRGYRTSVIYANAGQTAVGLGRKPLRMRADLVIIFLGSNDRLTRETALAYIGIAERHPNAYIVGPPAYRDRSLHARSRAVYRLQRRIFGAGSIDSEPCTIDLSGRTRDGVHFTRRGSRHWVDCILSEIEARRR